MRGPARHSDRRIIDVVGVDRIRTGGMGFPDLLAGGQNPREHQLALLLQLSLVAQRETSLDRIAHLTASYLRDALGCDFTKVLDARASAGGLLVRAGAGWPPGVVGEREVPEGLDSQAGFTLQAGQCVIVDDIANETRFEPAAPLLAEHGVRSGISVVIGSEPDVFGVLQADSRSTDSFGPADRELLDAFASVLAGAVAQLDREVASDHFASIAAHELRTPLTLIIGYATRLLRVMDVEGAIDADDRDALETIHTESLRLRHAVDLFLSLGDVDRHRPLIDARTVDLVDVVEGVVPMVSEHYPGGRIRIEPVDGSTEVITDGRSVARVVTVLVENAVKYTAPGTAVTVTIERDEDGAEVRVADACGGLSDDDLRRLFQRNYRGGHGSDERSGLGLGLYIAQRLAEHVGGELDARNADDGCIFSLRLPSVLEIDD
jgi:signal transduction histidine kinase